MNRGLGASVALMALLTTFSSVTAYVGPPDILPDRTVRAEIIASTGHRDVEFEARSAATLIQSVDLNLEQDAALARLSYAVSSDFLVRGVVGLSRMKLGNPVFGTLGALNMQGDFGQSFGIGIQYGMPITVIAPDMTLALSVDWRNMKSAIPGGNMEADELQIAFKGGKELGEFFPYGGVMYAPFEADFNGVTNAQVGTSGHFSAREKIGVFLGTTYRISDRMSARIEGEMLTTTGISFGLSYDLVAYLSDRKSVPPPPVSPTERAAVPPPPRESGGVLADPEMETDRRDVARANEEVERGNALANQGRTLESMRAYEIAIELDPGSYRARYNLATLHYRERNYAEAKRYYQELLSMNPSDVEALLYLGFSRYRTGDLEGAAVAWRRVLELDPANSLALNNLQALQR